MTPFSSTDIGVFNLLMMKCSPDRCITVKLPLTLILSHNRTSTYNSYLSNKNNQCYLPACHSKISKTPNNAPEAWHLILEVMNPSFCRTFSNKMLTFYFSSSPYYDKTPKNRKAFLTK